MLRWYYPKRTSPKRHDCTGCIDSQTQSLGASMWDHCTKSTECLPFLNLFRCSHGLKSIVCYRCRCAYIQFAGYWICCFMEAWFHDVNQCHWWILHRFTRLRFVWSHDSSWNILIPMYQLKISVRSCFYCRKQFVYCGIVGGRQWTRATSYYLCWIVEIIVEGSFRLHTILSIRASTISRRYHAYTLQCISE